MKIWKWVFFSLQAAGRGFSRNPTGSTPTLNPEIFGIFFCLKNRKDYSVKSIKKPLKTQISMFLGFENSKISGYCGVFFQVKTPKNS